MYGGRMKNRKLCDLRPNEEEKKRFLGIPMTENMRTGVKFLGPVIAIAAIEMGFGFYSECSRTKEHPKIETTTQQQGSSQSLDMPVPQYKWVAPVKSAVKDLSKKSDYEGQ